MRKIIEPAQRMLLLVELWAPVVGVMFVAESCGSCSQVTAVLWIPVVLATLGATLAMIEPGAMAHRSRLL